jgi:hypothetical protein
MQIAVSVERRSWFSTILTGKSQSLAGIHKEKHNHSVLYQQQWAIQSHKLGNGALDCPSEHFQPIFELQFAQHHANEIA